ncbi:MAG: phosphate ABC transporter permease PstA [Oligosphaeraceae bacterium]|nr:phosphate ABC transporter permease PstA [Oligosphaeraceae bacterium]
MKQRSLLLRKIKNHLLTAFSVSAIFFAVAIMLWVIWTVICHGKDALTPSLLVNCSAPYGSMAYGIGNAILGTMLITLGAAIIAIPPALLAGIFLAEYTEFPRLAGAISFAANVLMGMPSILVGLFVYTIIVVPTGKFSGFAGSVALAILMFPVIMRTTENMLSMVPNTLRESALALGMTRMRATLYIVCRSAKNGLLTGILLALSRVSGETAPLLFTAMFADSFPTSYFTQPTASLPILITEYATNSPFEVMHQIGWSAALVVMLLVLMTNISTRIFFREKKYGN